MKEIHTEPTNTHPETAVSSATVTEEQLAALFNHGWRHLINQQWRKAEAIFAKIESFNSHYEQDGMRAAALRRKAQYERIANSALETGELEAALIAFKKADDFEHAKEVHQLLTIQELEAKAEKATAVGSYQEAAWIYDHLLNDFPNHERETTWQIKKDSCWEAELLPFFLLGVQALDKKQWRTAYKAFAQVLLVDPYFRKDGRSATALSEIARKEVILLADQLLRQGQLKEALDAYREIGHTARIENVDEFLRLRHREEQTAQQLEAEGKWQEAVTKYNYLATLYYNENGRTQWQEAARRCHENHKVSTLYRQGLAAFNDKRWQEAVRLFGELLALRSDYQPGEEPVRKLYRAARWRSIASHFVSRPNTPSPKISTGNL
ncbi:tetratricopeptide repeat protein [Candidatus Leptofilum sp.]|uniref:tetratricopeptide repeat protein n=1 Tax=Candidatus Leptofilum sp. TaxID=3241576 RepID=UPI003B5B2CBB